MKLRFSMAHFSVKQRRPFKNSFCPSLRHRRQTASRCLANFYSPFQNPRSLKTEIRNSLKPQTRRRLGGRQPLCGIGVMSRISTICNPAAASARTADSRPEPGPFTRTSTLFMPYWSRATPAAASEACCAAYGVPLREPLKPMAPAEDQHMVRPSGSVMVICVLLNDAATYTNPCGTTRRSRFFLNSFLRFAAAGLAGAAPSGVVAAVFGPFASFATIHSIPEFGLAQTGRGKPRPYKLTLLADGLLLGCDGAAPRTFAGTRVGVRALAANRQIAPMTNPAIGLNFNQAADVHLNLLAEIAFDAAFLLDGLADVIDFIFRQVANLFRVIHASFCGELFCALLPDSIDGRQSNPEALLDGKIYTCDACHNFSKFSVVSYKF